MMMTTPINFDQAESMLIFFINIFSIAGASLFGYQVLYLFFISLVISMIAVPTALSSHVLSMTSSQNFLVCVGLSTSLIKQLYKWNAVVSYVLMLFISFLVTHEVSLHIYAFSITGLFFLVYFYWLNWSQFSELIMHAVFSQLTHRICKTVAINRMDQFFITSLMNSATLFLLKSKSHYDSVFTLRKCIYVCEVGVICTLATLAQLFVSEQIIGLIKNRLQASSSELIQKKKSTADERTYLAIQVGVIIPNILFARYYMYKTLNEDPLFWIWKFLMLDERLRLLLCMYWLATVSVSIVVAEIGKSWKWPQICMRKIFHVLTVALFAPPLLRPQLFGFLVSAWFALMRIFYLCSPLCLDSNIRDTTFAFFLRCCIPLPMLHHNMQTSPLFNFAVSI